MQATGDTGSPCVADGILQETGPTHSINTLEDDIEVELVGDTLVFHGVSTKKLDPIIEELPTLKHTDKYEIKVYNIPEQALIQLIKILPFEKIATVLIGMLQGISIVTIINILSKAGLTVLKIIQVIFEMLSAATDSDGILEDIEDYIQNKDEPEEELSEELEEPEEYPEVGDDEGKEDDNISDPYVEEEIEPDEPIEDDYEGPAWEPEEPEPAPEPEPGPATPKESCVA